jgi:hypothetical protein
MAIKYCPQCGAEYQDWVEKCLDCDMKLVDTKPEEDLETEDMSGPEIIDIGDESYTSEPLVKIAEYEDAVNAQFNKDLLQSEGIKSMIYDGSSAGNWAGIRPKMPLSLIVREEDKEKALTILNSIDANEPLTIIPEIAITEDEEYTEPD